MKNLGLTKERYQQLMSVFGDEETVKEVIKDWTIETCNKGYTILTPMEQECSKYVELIH